MGNPYAPPGESPRPQEQPQEAGGRGPAQGAGRAPDGRGPDREQGHGRGPGQDAPDGPGGRPGGGPGGGPGGAEHGGAPDGPGSRQPAAPDSEIARATSRRVLHFLAFLLASVLTGALPLPWQVASLVFVGAAVVTGIRALVLAWRGGLRGGLVIMLAVGVAMAGFVGLAMLSFLALWPEQVERQDCLARAVTISATRACELEFQRAVEERLGDMGRSTGS